MGGLLPDRRHREHALVFVYGPGGNGKSVFLNVLTKISRTMQQRLQWRRSRRAPTDKHPTDLAMLRGARLVTSSETEEGRAWAETRIKQMTGGDPITARFMRRDFFTYHPMFKLTIIGNNKPVSEKRGRSRTSPLQHRALHPQTGRHPTASSRRSSRRSGPASCAGRSMAALIGR